MVDINGLTIKKGDRVEIPIYTDKWFQGARYGVVTSAGSMLICVKLDHPQGGSVRVIGADCKKC